MESNSLNEKQLIDELASLRRDLGQLSERIAALETILPRGDSPVASPTPVATAMSAQTPMETISEELILVLSAAVAAFLGVKPRIRQIRLLGSSPWTQQGRATIQASHSISIHHN